MKIVFYFDIYPWTTGNNDIYPVQTICGDKPINAIRYKIETEIPDPKQPDAVIIAESIPV